MLQGLVLARLIGQYPGLLELGDLSQKRFQEYDAEDFTRIGRALGLKFVPHADLIHAARVFLEEEDIGRACELVQSPEAVTQVVALLTGGIDGLAATSGVPTDEVPEMEIRFIS